MTKDRGIRVTTEERAQALEDRDALDFIAAALDGSEWDTDHLDVIAEVVRGTGREIKDPSFRFCEDCEGIDDHEEGCEHA